VSKSVLTDVSFKINAVDLSDHLRSIDLNIEAAQVDTTSMGGGGYGERLGGLKNWSADLELFQDFAAANVDATLAPIFSTVVACTFKAVKSTATSATNPEYQGNATLIAHNPLRGAVNEASMTRVRLVGSGPLVRAIV
jgi:predicted secreted protein